MILLPVVVLTAVGLLSLRHDQALAEQEARERAGRLAQEFADRAFAQLFELAPDAATNTRVVSGRDWRWPVFELSPEGVLLWPEPVERWPVPRLLDLSRLEPSKREVWESWLRARELGDRDARHRAGRAFLAADPPSDFAANALFDLAELEVRLNKAEEAGARFAQIAANYPDARGESGLPLAPLARWRVSELGWARATNAATRGVWIEAACSNLVLHPTVLTPALLRRVAELVRSSSVPDRSPALPRADGAAQPDPAQGNPLILEWWRRWEITEVARELFAAARADWERRNLPVVDRTARLGPGSPGEPTGRRRVATQVSVPLWVERGAARTNALSGFGCDRQEWLLMQVPAGDLRFRALTLCEVTNRLERARRQLPDLPSYFAVTVTFAGKTLPGVPGTLLLAERPAREASRTGALEAGLTAGVYLVDAAALYARQRQRTRWFAGLVLAAAVTAGVGLVGAHRTFERQLRLGEMKSNFVSSVSHELRAPIAAVRLLAESLDRGKVSDEARRREYFRLIVQECRRLSSLIENVLDFSRIDQGRKRYEFEPTDLAALVDQTVRLLEPYAAEREVALQLVGVGGFSRQPHLDGKAVQQALVNLIDNAVKHSPPGATVQIALETRPTGGTGAGPAHPELRPGPRAGDPPQAAAADPVANAADASRPAQAAGGTAGRASQRVVCRAPSAAIILTVTDRGPGIPAGERERIFEPFHRLGSELRRETPGIGIGLSIVKHVVEGHGGRVRVESEPGRGSRFVVELPLDEA